MSKPAKVSEEVRLALLASGVEVDDSAPDAETETALETEVLETEIVPEADPALEAAPAEKESDEDPLETLLQLTRDNTRLELKVEQLEARLASQDSTSALACNALRVATGRLAAVMGGSAVLGLDSANLETLCSHFNQLNEAFEKRFPNRAVARATPKAETPGIDPEMTRRMNAVRKQNTRK